MTKEYTPLHSHSEKSTLDGVASVEDIVKRCQEIGVTRCGISDHGNLYAATEWITATKKAGILGLVGIEFYICQTLATNKDKDNRKLSHLILTAKNTAGYKQLVRLVSRSNSNDCFYYYPRLSLQEIAEMIGKDKGNLICLTGHLGSTLSDYLITEERDDKGRGTNVFHLNEHWKSSGLEHIYFLNETFGQENVGIEIQTYHEGSGFDELKTHNRILAKLSGNLAVATGDSHYAWQHQAELQRISLCIKQGKTLAQAMHGDSELGIFFASDRLYLPSREELRQWGNTEDELDNTIKITEECEELEIFSSPKIPTASIPEPYTKSIDYLTDLCREGYKVRYPNNSKEYAKQIGERVKYELDAINKCGLTDYFLLIHKIVNWCKSKGILTSVRGSAAGCCVNYLLGVSHFDPVKYGLLWERFFNEGRIKVNEDGTKEYNLPDTDLDVQASKRQEVIQFLRDEYGPDNVGQIVTFSTLKGRNALKDTCKALGTVSESDINKITALMPEEHIIDDDLRIIAEEIGHRSIIHYCLQHMDKTFAPYARLNADGTISGPMAKEFTIARLLEGVTRGVGIHAAGVIVNTEEDTLVDSLPMVGSGSGAKRNDKIIAISMHEIERFGVLKLDLLGSSTLDSIQTMYHFHNTGEYIVHEKPD